MINKIKLKVVFLENVANLVKHDEGRTFEIICKTLQDLKYHVTWQVMNAKEYGGVPQQRNRIYIVAFRNKKIMKRFRFPDKMPLEKTAFEISPIENKCLFFIKRPHSII